LRKISDVGESIDASVVADLNRRYSSDPFIFVSTRDLFAGTQPGFEGPNHELFATHVNPNRWFIQPFVDAQSGVQGTAQTLNPLDFGHGGDVLYHPNARGWAAEGQLIYDDRAVPR
jgi:hypothetical protein